jgi:hypothetical protein
VFGSSYATSHANSWCGLHIEAKEDQPSTYQLLTEKAGLFQGNPMYLVEVVKEQRLVRKFQPIRQTEKGRADHYYLRVHWEKGTPKEKTTVAEEEVALEPAEMMRRPEEKLMRKMFCMARRHKGSKVVVGAKELFVLEVIKVAKPLEAGVTKAPLKAAQGVHTPREMAHPGVAREASPESAHAMGPDLSSDKP